MKALPARARISLIAAMARNRVIGRDNRLPWSLPEDLRRFRQLTRGHPVIMGRKTYESIGRPLPDRLNIVISRAPDRLALAGGVRVAGSLAEALGAARGAPTGGESEIFVIGGGEVYAQALPLADRIYLTVIEQDVAGDAYFPDFPAADFAESSRERRRDGDWEYSFRVLERSRAAFAGK